MNFIPLQTNSTHNPFHLIVLFVCFPFHEKKEGSWVGCLLSFVFSLCGALAAAAAHNPRREQTRKANQPLQFHQLFNHKLSEWKDWFHFSLPRAFGRLGRANWFASLLFALCFDSFLSLHSIHEIKDKAAQGEESKLNSLSFTPWASFALFFFISFINSKEEQRELVPGASLLFWLVAVRQLPPITNPKSKTIAGPALLALTHKFINSMGLARLFFGLVALGSAQPITHKEPIHSAPFHWFIIRSRCAIRRNKPHQFNLPIRKRRLKLIVVLLMAWRG